MKAYQSWGRYPSTTAQQIYQLRWQDSLKLSSNNDSLLAYGQGRSYGDVCLNDQGTLLDTRSLDRFLHFDPQQGLLRCEAGVTLADILQLTFPHGWFLPVTPGTKFVSIAGAVANDVHGKNHHCAGTFGCHVRSLELLRSSGERLVCSPAQNSELFAATIGGLGLTGLISWVELQLKKVSGPYIEQESLRFHNLDEFFELSAQSDKDWEYTVSWIDCLARGKQLGRGLFMRGNHSETAAEKASDLNVPLPGLNMPLDAPGFLLNRATIHGFNQLYYKKPIKQHQRVHFEPFFYPLDKIAHWNRLYGKRGFFQYQCVIPQPSAKTAMHAILTRIAQSGQGSFLSVLKQFGDMPSPGMLSFPRQGVTLALDFAHHGQSTFKLLDELDAITLANEGAVYPAKDARMSAQAFQHYFPEWKAFSNYIDPAFSSSFWRRVTLTTE